MSKITIIENTLDPESFQTFECSDVREFLKQRYDKFPETGRLFLDHVAEASDVTPFDESGIERLGKLEGHFFLVVYPELPFWAILLIVAIAVAAVSIIVGFLLRPSMSPSIKNNQQASPNNSLSDRQNSQRIAQRICDIFGTVQSIPDLLSVPLKVFKNNQEVELCYMCIGRGEYEIEKFNAPIVIDLIGIPRNPTPGP